MRNELCAKNAKTVRYSTETIYFLSPKFDTTKYKGFYLLAIF